MGKAGELVWRENTRCRERERPRSATRGIGKVDDPGAQDEHPEGAESGNLGAGEWLEGISPDPRGAVGTGRGLLVFPPGGHDQADGGKVAARAGKRRSASPELAIGTLDARRHAGGDEILGGFGRNPHGRFGRHGGT